MEYMAITLSEEAALFLIGSVVSGLVAAIGVLWRAKETNDKAWRQDSERLFTVVDRQNDTIEKFTVALDTHTRTIEKLADEVGRCPHIVRGI